MKPSPTGLDDVREFMRKNKLTPDDLINYGGGELYSAKREIADKARKVSRCWELMARFGVRHANLTDNI